MRVLNYRIFYEKNPKADILSPFHHYQGVLLMEKQ